MDSMPNPGSDDARAAGCLCPVLDNNHGRFAPFPARAETTGESGSYPSAPEAWYIVPDCPLHGASKEIE